MPPVILLHLDEPDGVLPSDALGHLDDLGLDPATTAPASVATWTGRGRRFVQASSTALIADDLPAGDTVLLRDVTVQALLSLTLAGAAGAQTIICRGVNDGSASEYVCWGLEVEEQGAHPGFVEVRWFWQDSTGTLKTQPAGVFKSPGDGVEFMLTATRRWEATDRVVLRYLVDEQLIAELVSTDGDIGGGTTGHTTLGGRKDTGAWSAFLNGTIDELVVFDNEVSPEEIREDWRRMAVHLPAGVEMFTGLIPPGAPWADNPGNDIGRLVKLAGQALGFGIASIERLRALFLPDRATLDKIPRWERMCRLAPGPRDSLDRRRSRVVAFQAQERGFSIPEIQGMLAEPFDLPAEQVQILEFTNAIEDGFAAALDSQRWLVGDAGVWAVAAGELGVTAAAGADIRWLPTFATSHVRTSLPAIGGQMAVTAKLSSWTMPVNTIAGLFLLNRVTNDALWFGVKNVGGTKKLGYHVCSAGVLAAFVALEDPAAASAHWLRISRAKGAAEGTLDLAWSITGPSSGFTTTNVVTGLTGLAWAGLAAMSTDAALATDLAANFDDFRAFSANGLRTFMWYAFRDPLLPGAPDMAAADLLIQRIKPAHTYARAIASKSLLANDRVLGGCRRGPMGALD